MKQSLVCFFAASLAAAPAAAQTPRRLGTAFNPAISVVLNGTAAYFKQDPGTYALPGFALGEETGPGVRGLSLGESELVLESNIDDWFFGSLTAALVEEDGAAALELEEAYFQTLALPGGFTAKGGRFFSRIGYLNESHAHVQDFVDAPLAYRTLLGNQYGDDGVQLRWLAPTDVFLEAGGELFRGSAYPGAGAAHDGAGAYTGFAHLGGDVGTSWSYRAGLSYLHTQAQDRETGATLDRFTGEATLALADFVLKWAPEGNAKNVNFKLQGEYLRRAERGSFNTAEYEGIHDGAYLQAVWQFMPRWRTGARYDALRADNSGAAVTTGGTLDNDARNPVRASVLLEHAHSEFSRLRLQYNRDGSQRLVDDQVFLNYVFALGAHTAHAF